MVTPQRLQRAAQDRRGAAGARQVHLRDDRAREGHRHHPLAHPPLPVPARAARADARVRAAALRRARASRSSPACCRSSCAPAAARCATRSRCSTSSSPAPRARPSSTSAPSRCSATPTARCSTRSSTRSARATPAAAFAAVDRVIQTGQDPRRFVEDLLERLRDLIVVAATSPATAAAVLRGVPQDELDRMAEQAAAFGSAELSRAADVVNPTLTEMTGATSPRLHLELMVARLLVPERRRLRARRARPGRAPRASRRRWRIRRGPSGHARQRSGRAAAHRHLRAVRRSSIGAAGVETPADPVASPGPDTPAAPASRPAEAEAAPAARPAKVATTSAEAEPKPAAKPVGPVTLKQIRDAWPEVLASLQRTKRTAWMAALSAQVLEYRTDDDVLVLGFASPSDVQGLRSGTGNQNSAELLRTAIHEVLGVTVKFLPRVVGGNAGAHEAGPPPQGSAPVAGAGASMQPAQPAQAVDRPAPKAAAPKSAVPAAPTVSAAPRHCLGRAYCLGRACRARRHLGDGRDPERSRPRARGRARDRVAPTRGDHGRRA